MNYIIYFSPTETTRNVIELFQQSYQSRFTTYNFTQFTWNDACFAFHDDDFVVFAFPVYSGRVPETFMARLFMKTKTKGEKVSEIFLTKL